MKRILVTLSVQTEINYHEMDDEAYEEELEHLISDLEDMGLNVNVETEESLDEDDEGGLLH